MRLDVHNFHGICFSKQVDYRKICWFVSSITSHKNVVISGRLGGAASVVAQSRRLTVKIAPLKKSLDSTQKFPPTYPLIRRGQGLPWLWGNECLGRDLVHAASGFAEGDAD